MSSKFRALRRSSVDCQIIFKRDKFKVSTAKDFPVHIFLYIKILNN